jgi:hypothetical protein
MREEIGYSGWVIGEEESDEARKDQSGIWKQKLFENNRLLRESFSTSTRLFDG